MESVLTLNRYQMRMVGYDVTVDKVAQGHLTHAPFHVIILM